MKNKWLRRLLILLCIAAVGVAWGAVYVRNNPLVFNESFWQHAHCIKQGTLALMNYADKLDGKFPSHPNGYGDALLMLDEDVGFTIMGTGYDEAPYHQTKRDGTHLAEEDCGRVYVQGLTTTPKAGLTKIVILFDKLPTPGGDHCHLFSRMSAPLGREVGYADGHSHFVPETDWPAFAKEQVELLVNEGFPRAEAERLYASQAKVGR